jgi:glycosyltransferase involved in cell wall biosynthesis
MAISVVMPVWNMSGFLERSVRSVLNQTYRDFELIAVDDGSTDDTANILLRIAAGDPRVRVISQKNSGIVRALNRGIEEARYEYVARADGDDLYEPERFAVQTSYLDSHADVGLVCCNYDLSYPDGTRVRKILPEGHRELLRILMRRNDIMHSSVMMRRSSLIEAGCYLEKWRHLEDYELWFRLARRTKLACVPNVLATYRMHPGGISQTKELYQVRGGVAVRLREIVQGHVPISWARFMAPHLVKAIIPSDVLRWFRRLHGKSKGLIQ